MSDQGILSFRKSSGVDITVEQALEDARGLSRRADPDSRATAANAFAEAEKLALACADPKMQMRVYEASGDHLNARGAPGIAKEKYETALRSARLLAVTSDEGVADVERLRFRLTEVRNAKDPLFTVFEKVARPYPYEKRNTAWASFERDRADPEGRLAARGFASEKDFRRRLDAAKCTPGNDEDEEIPW